MSYTPVLHTVAITRTPNADGPFRAECDCGWVSRNVRDRRAARRRVGHHADHRAYFHDTVVIAD